MKTYCKIFITVLILLTESQSLFSQIPITKKQTVDETIDTSSTPNYFKKYIIPDFDNPSLIIYPGVRGYRSPWCLYDFITHYLKGEKILYIGKGHSTEAFRCVDKGNGRIDFEDVTLPPLTYFTVGNYYVCKEQIDSLQSVFIQKGFKCKLMAKAPESLSEFQKLNKKKYAEYQAQLAEYESLPYYFPAGLDLKYNSEYVDLQTWNNTPHSAQYGYLIELIDDNDIVYYVYFHHLAGEFISVSLWNNYLSKLKGQKFHSWRYSSENRFVFEGAQSIENCDALIGLYSSFALDYTCTDIALKEDDPRYVEAEFTDGRGEVVRGELGWEEEKDGETESNVLVFKQYDNTIGPTELLTKEQIVNHLKVLEIQKEELIKKEAEHDEAMRRFYADILEMYTRNLAEMKAKYGDYYGNNVANHNVVAGMSKDMVIDAMILPPGNTEVYRTLGHLFERWTYVNKKNYKVIEFTDGKVTAVYSNKVL